MVGYRGYRGSGWFGDSYRHYLAAKGMRSSYLARRGQKRVRSIEKYFGLPPDVLAKVFAAQQKFNIMSKKDWVRQGNAESDYDRYVASQRLKKAEARDLILREYPEYISKRGMARSELRDDPLFKDYQKLQDKIKNVRGQIRTLKSEGLPADKYEAELEELKEESAELSGALGIDVAAEETELRKRYGEVTKEFKKVPMGSKKLTEEEKRDLALEEFSRRSKVAAFREQAAAYIGGAQSKILGKDVGSRKEFEKAYGELVKATTPTEDMSREEAEALIQLRESVVKPFEKELPSGVPVFKAPRPVAGAGKIPKHLLSMEGRKEPTKAAGFLGTPEPKVGRKPIVKESEKKAGPRSEVESQLRVSQLGKIVPKTTEKVKGKSAPVKEALSYEDIFTKGGGED